MGNRLVTFQYTKFVNMDRDLKDEGSVTYGYRMYKGDKCTYNNLAASPREFFSIIPDILPSVIEHIKTSHPDFWEIIQQDGMFMYCNRKVIIEGDKYRYSM